MNRKVLVKPRWSGALTFWLGSDEYSLGKALKRAPLELQTQQIMRILQIESKSLVTRKQHISYGIEYQSEFRECYLAVNELPKEIESLPRTRISNRAAANFLFQHSWREPSALLMPFVLPFFIAIMIALLGMWDEYVLHDKNILSFFARPGCDVDCVANVLRIHTLVAFLFLIPIGILLLPIAFLLIQGPRYRSAINYRLLQGYSTVTVVVGIFVLAQLMVFFPFKQYGKFAGLGFDPKVERLLANLKNKKQQ